jgi:hypothetical protein
MKRIFFLAIGIILMASQAFAFDAALSPAAITSDGMGCTGKCYMTGLTVYTDGTNDATVVVYNGTSTAGQEVFRTKVFGGLYADKISWTYPLACEQGIYLDLTGTGAAAIVEFVRK